MRVLCVIVLGDVLYRLVLLLLLRVALFSFCSVVLFLFGFPLCSFFWGGVRGVHFLVFVYCVCFLCLCVLVCLLCVFVVVVLLCVSVRRCAFCLFCVVRVVGLLCVVLLLCLVCYCCCVVCVLYVLVFVYCACFL